MGKYFRVSMMRSSTPATPTSSAPCRRNKRRFDALEQADRGAHVRGRGGCVRAIWCDGNGILTVWGPWGVKGIRSGEEDEGVCLWLRYTLDCTQFESHALCNRP